uniref:TraB domain-containing protein n=1 Tax=Aegilops tauschii subsp. strangulata TaxID=200361 RepID=A0A452ZGF1_AEGTS
MIRPPRLLLHRAPFLLRTPQPPRAPPLPARRALTPTLRSFASRRPAPLCLLMDPATPFSDARADAYAEFNGETGVDDPEFADAEAEAGGEDAGFDGPRELPEELARGVVCLECVTSAEAVAAGEGETCRVYVVGTAHVSQESCDQVKAVINFLKPQAVFLELCSSRVSILTPQNLQVPTMNEMIDMWKKKKMNTFGILYSWFLAKVCTEFAVQSVLI